MLDREAVSLLDTCRTGMTAATKSAATLSVRSLGFAARLSCMFAAAWSSGVCSL